MEVWKDVKGYEDYQVSNLGRVKSLKWGKERVLRARFDSTGYLLVVLSLNGKTKSRRVHQLVSVAFLNHEPCRYKLVVNHIDFNKTNNNVSNLEIVTQRENTNHKHLKSSSKYTGVSWDKQLNKWRSKIFINRKQKHLGYYTSEIEASEAYQNELKNIKS